MTWKKSQIKPKLKKTKTIRIDEEISMSDPTKIMSSKMQTPSMKTPSGLVMRFRTSDEEKKTSGSYSVRGSQQVKTFSEAMKRHQSLSPSSGL